MFYSLDVSKIFSISLGFISLPGRCDFLSILNFSSGSPISCMLDYLPLSPSTPGGSVCFSCCIFSFSLDNFYWFIFKFFWLFLFCANAMLIPSSEYFISVIIIFSFKIPIFYSFHFSVGFPALFIITVFSFSSLNIFIIILIYYLCLLTLG